MIYRAFQDFVFYQVNDHYHKIIKVLPDKVDEYNRQKNGEDQAYKDQVMETLFELFLYGKI